MDDIPIKNSTRSQAVPPHMQFKPLHTYVDSETLWLVNQVNAQLCADQPQMPLTKEQLDRAAQILAILPKDDSAKLDSMRFVHNIEVSLIADLARSLEHLPPETRARMTASHEYLNSLSPFAPPQPLSLEEQNVRRQLLESAQGNEFLVKQPLRELMAAMGNGSITSADLRDSEISTSISKICEARQVMLESGFTDHFAEFIKNKESAGRGAEDAAPSKASQTKQNTVAGYGYMLQQTDSALILSFMSGAEEKVPHWQALLQAYNMRHPEQVPVTFARAEKTDGYANGYIARAEPEVLREVAAYLHQKLPELGKAPEQSVPNVSAQAHDTSRGRG